MGTSSPEHQPEAGKGSAAIDASTTTAQAIKQAKIKEEVGISRSILPAIERMGQVHTIYHGHVQTLRNLQAAEPFLEQHTKTEGLRSAKLVRTMWTAVT